MRKKCTVKGLELRARLSALGLTQTALAERCGIELRTFQRWLAGGRLSLDDAEQVAAALGVGTAMVFDGVPSEEPLVAQARATVRVLGSRMASIGGAFRLSLEHFDSVLRLASFSAHPPVGYVHSEPVAPEAQHAFVVLDVQAPPGRALRIALTTQVGRRFRYEFGELRVTDTEVVLVEHQHTRSARANRAPDGSFSLWSWAAPEMRALVLVATDDVQVRRSTGRGPQLFDLDDPRTRHAVCTRPAPMHLEAARLPKVFDRVVGPREGRIDVPVPNA